MRTKTSEDIEMHLCEMVPTLTGIIQHKHPFANFLLNSPIGQMLVSNGLFTHPLIKAKEQHQEEIYKLAQQFHSLGVAASNSEAVDVVLQQPDFIPRDIETIYLEATFDRVFESRLVNIVDGDIDHDAGSFLDLEKEMSENIQKISDQTKAQIYLNLLPQVIYNKTVIHLREQILSFVETDNWVRLFTLLANNYNHPILSSPLHQVLIKIVPSLFTNKKFREYAFQHMIKFRVEKGSTAMENFDEYLAGLGLSFSDSAERHQYADENFLRYQLSRQWERGDYQEYFQSIQFFFDINLLPIWFFRENKNPEFFRNFYEFGLLAMYGETSSFKQQLNSLAKSWGLPPNKQITLTNQYHFYGRYSLLCSLEDQPLHPKIAKLFSPPNPEAANKR